FCGDYQAEFPVDICLLLVLKLCSNHVITVAQYPSPTSARVMRVAAVENGVTVISGWSQRNLERGKTVNMIVVIIIIIMAVERCLGLGCCQNLPAVVPIQHPSSPTVPGSKLPRVFLYSIHPPAQSLFYFPQVSVRLLSAFSQSEQLRGVVREIQVESNKKKQFLEVWKSQQLFKVFDLAALEVHGDVYCDNDFGSLHWSPCEEKLLYIAEKKLPKTEPFYKPKPQENKEDGHGNGKVLKVI
ncbi:hypothetical protein C0J52_17007, partial [Blattella germanica]